MAKPNPDLGRPRACWDELDAETQQLLREHVQSVPGVPCELVCGWEAAAAVVGVSSASLRRAARKGRLPVYRLPDRGYRGSTVVWALSQLLAFRRWKMAPQQLIDTMRGGDGMVGALED